MDLTVCPAAQFCVVVVQSGNARRKRILPLGANEGRDFFSMALNLEGGTAKLDNVTRAGGTAVDYSEGVPDTQLQTACQRERTQLRHNRSGRGKKFCYHRGNAPLLGGSLPAGTRSGPQRTILGYSMDPPQGVKREQHEQEKRWGK